MHCIPIAYDFCVINARSRARASFKTTQKVVAFSKRLGLRETNHHFFLGNENGTEQFLIHDQFELQRSPFFYTVIIDQFLLQSKMKA